MKKEGHQESLDLRVLRFMRGHQLLPRRGTLLVAVSGGPDSVCLLDILVKLQAELGIRLHVAHLDHQLRGAEAEADAAYVADLAHRLGLPATIEKRDVKAYQIDKHLSVEEAAREVRYTFLAHVAHSIGTDQVAVGHTTDDHIETILMHLIRGAGTRGLRGLQARVAWQFSSNQLTVIRPLLGIGREETAEYCRGHQLMPRIDTSNLSLSPLRNRIRHQLLPLLKSYNQRIAEALLRTARIADDDLAFLDGEVSRIWDTLAQWRENTIALDKEGFLGLSPAIQRHLLRFSIEKLRGLKDIEARHIEEIMAALTKPAGKRLSLPGGLVFSIEYDRYLLASDEAALSPFPPLAGELPLVLPGETLLSGWRITATTFDLSTIKGKFEGTLSLQSLQFPLMQGRYSYYGEGDKGGEVGKQSYKACFDLDKAGGELVVRARQPGDRFQPLGMSQPKKLGEFMIDAKIPRAWRGQIPIICSANHILWVVGWRIDERVKVTDATNQILCLEFERI